MFAQVVFVFLLLLSPSSMPAASALSLALARSSASISMAIFDVAILSVTPSTHPGQSQILSMFFREWGPGPMRGRHLGPSLGAMSMAQCVLLSAPRSRHLGASFCIRALAETVLVSLESQAQFGAGLKGWALALVCLAELADHLGGSLFAREGRRQPRLGECGH